MIGAEMYGWISEMFPICRSITGEGFRSSLKIIGKVIPDLRIEQVKSGTKAMDWVVPDEWSITEAYIEDQDGNLVVNFKDNNLHIVGYSEPVNKWMTLEDLNEHLYSLPDMPDTIPYVTSYYSRRWGFCITHNKRMTLLEGRYKVVIKSQLFPGVLNYGEVIYPGKEDKEVFFSTYLCHPSMANNELSGPSLAMALAREVSRMADRRFTYRFIFIPETIGSIVYLSKNLDKLKKNTICGFNLTCVGDDRNYSFLPSRQGNTLADKLALYVLKSRDIKFEQYTFLSRGSDERQYCWPGVDLPIASIMRSKYGTYPEYHTSDDNLDLVSPEGLQGSFELYMDCIKTIEANHRYTNTVTCEPNLGRRGLYPTISTLEKKLFPMDLINFMVGHINNFK